MNKKLLASLVAAFATLAVSSTAFADQTLPEITIYGKRPPRPNITIELKRQTAAQAAGDAHESLRQSLVESSRPANFSH